jgi:hypothetical protein
MDVVREHAFSAPRIGSVPQRLPRRDGSEVFRKGCVMQHSAVDLENYARLYQEDRLRDAARRRQSSEVVTGASLLERTVTRVQSWFTAGVPESVSQAQISSQPVQLVPSSNQPAAASADPYAGMIVLVRGPRADAA